MANIAIGKMGKTLEFKPEKWGAIGGDNEAPTLFLKLAELNPQNTYYVIGCSNFSKMPDDFQKKYSNIVDPWKDWDSKNKDWVARTQFPYKWCVEHNVVMDGGVFYNGPVSYTSIPECRFYPDGKTYYTPLTIFKRFNAPIHDFCNRSKLKYLSLCVDPRYFPYKSADLFVRPAKILSQYNATTIMEYGCIESYENVMKHTPVKEVITYDEIEKVFFMGREKYDFSKLDKTTKMLIVLNEGKNGVKSRGPKLENYVLRNFKDVEVYGDWSKEWVDKYPDNFKGPKKFIELEPMLKSVKYTFIIPIAPGWVTSKFWEMLHFGIVPFLHPDYDAQHHLPTPKILRVSSPKELKDRIELLESHPDAYQKLLTHLNGLLLDSYYDGTYMNEVINRNLKEIGVSI